VSEPYVITARGGFLRAAIASGRNAGIPLALVMALNDDLLHERVTPDEIRQRGWRFEPPEFEPPEFEPPE
jgi:hypothetical protein